MRALLGRLRCEQRAALPRLCVLILLGLAALVLLDVVPRTVIVASQPRETAYWEAWEEAYVDRCRHWPTHIIPMLRMRTQLCMHTACPALLFQTLYSARMLPSCRLCITQKV